MAGIFGLLTGLFVLSLFVAAIYAIIRMLPKRRWRTGPVISTVFAVSFIFGLSIDMSQMNLSGGNLLVISVVIFGAMAFALIPSALALIWCAVHNRRAAAQEET